jgi:beta-glucosidase
MHSPDRLSITLLVTFVSAVHAFAAIPGDFDDDGIVSFGDLDILTACLAGPDADPGAGCTDVDQDGDGDADLRDFSRWVPQWQSMDCRITASASSIEGTGPLFHPWNAVDGLQSTRWSSAFADNQWIQLEFAHERTFDGLTIHWETAYARDYTVLVSDDGASWTPIFSTTAGDGGIDEIAFSPQVARYLRIRCTHRATEWGNSIWEIKLWSDDRCYVDQRSVEERVNELIGLMTLEEKASFVHGETAMSLRAIPRLGIPALQLADGPLGIRAGSPATAFPAPIALAASWDTNLAWRFGEAIGKEFRNKGRQVWLGPGMNIIRLPQCGRNFEYYSEDPYLASRMAVAAVQGAQSQRVVACAKHYAGNNQEQDRGYVSVEVDERSLREIYLPAFEAATREGGARAVMAAYNRVRGAYCTANRYLLTDILKNEWGFPGLVVSDWGAVHETVAPANAGLDLEMDGSSPVGAFWGNGQLLAALQGGQVSAATVDGMVRRILRAILFTGIVDEAWDSPDIEIVEHRALARQIAADGIVLLKNNNAVLPLDKSTPHTVAVVGPRYAQAQHGGGGSSYVTPYYTVSPLTGLQNVAAPNVTFVDAPGVPPDDNWVAVDTSFLTPPAGGGHGLRGEYFNNQNLQGTPVVTRTDPTVDFWWGSGSPATGIPADHFSVRWTGFITAPHTADWDLGMATDDGFRLYLDGTLLIADWQDHGLRLTRQTVHLEAGHAYNLTLEYYENWGDAAAFLVCQDNSEELDEAIELARNADAALVFVGLTSDEEGEGSDRSSIDLTYAETKLIRGVAAVNPRTAVVIVAGSQVGFDGWIDDAPAVVQAWYGGQEAGNAIAAVLFGDVNPSAKLPMTFVRRWEDHPAFGLYPSGNYSEGLDVGYRYFDHAPVEPAFPFGHGLSYTTFAYSNLIVDTSAVPTLGVVNVRFDVENTGALPGREVAQVYVRDPVAGVARPVKELKGFAKVALSPGARQPVSIALNQRAFAYYDDSQHDWRVEPGAFEIIVAASSCDIRLQQTITYP